MNKKKYNVKQYKVKAVYRGKEEKKVNRVKQGHKYKKVQR